MKQDNFLVKIKKELYGYSNIPKDLGDYIVEVIKKDKEEHLLPVILKGNERKEVWEKIDYQIKKATNITKLSLVELLKALDFHSKDINFSKFNAMLAELRTIHFLSNLNLYNITPLQAKKGEKCADIIATGGSDKYVIEVFCKISQSSSQTEDESIKDLENNTILNHPYTYEDDLFQYYIDKSIPKKIQLDNTAKKYKCNKRIMVLVLNDPNIFGFLTPDECTKILSKISTELDWGSNYYFAIVTGLVSLDIIYPPITL